MNDKSLKLQQEIDSLRSDMEHGKIRIRVCTDVKFRQELSKAIALDYANTPKNGWHYAKPCLGQVSFQSGGFIHSHWNASSVLVVPVVEFMDSDPNQFPIKTWESSIGKEIFRSIVADWREQVDPDLDFDLEECLGIVLDWAMENPKYSMVVKKTDECLQQKLVEKINPLIKDELFFKIPNNFSFLEKNSFPFSESRLD
jgi:hypothetical protein